MISNIVSEGVELHKKGVWRSAIIKFDEVLLLAPKNVLIMGKKAQ